MTRDARNFFVIGCDRSGTSLLTRMLNGHPEVGVPFESHIFNHLYPLKHHYGDLGRSDNLGRLARDMVSLYQVRQWDYIPPPKDIASATTDLSFCGVFDALMRVWLEHEEKSIWGEKSPGHIQYLEVLTDHFRSSPLIHIVRDGRDVALSLIDVRFGPKTVYTAIRYWKWYLGLVEEARRRSGSRIMDVRYEELLKSPRGELERICGFLGIRYQESMLNYYQNQSPYDTDRRNLENLGKPLLTANAHRWRKEMTSPHVRISEALASAELSQYGYDLTMPRASVGRIERVWRDRFEWRPKRAVSMLKNWRRGATHTYCMSLIRLRLARECLLRM